MREDKWEMYIEALQGHPSICSSSHTVEGMRFITDILPPEFFPKLLDIGAGEGMETRVLKDLGYDVTGITRGKINSDFARRNYPGINFFDCDMHDLPFPSESFDAIYLNQVFEHTFAPFIFLLELYCVLRMGGRVWMAFPCFKEITDPTISEHTRISHHHPNMLCYNLLNQYFNATGFRVVDKYSIEAYPYYDNPYLLEKVGGMHSDVITAVNKRRAIYG